MKRIFSLKDRSYFIIIFLVSLIIYCGAIWRVKSIIWGDSFYYYAYTRSIIIDHDIDFANEAYREDFGFPNQPEISPVTQKITNKFSPGVSLLWIPAFVLGHSLSKSYEFIGLIDIADGYNFITQFIVAISSILFSVLGLYFVYKLILIFFEKKIALISTLFLFLSTQIFYYTALDPLNSHSASFMLSGLFLYLCVIFSRSKNLNQAKMISWQKMIILGIVAGMIVLVRNQDLVVLIPASIYLLTTKNESLMNSLNNMILFWGNIFLVVSAQLFTTLSLYGQIGSPYLIRGEQLSWFNPDIYRVLFSFGNGLFSFAPILIFAVWGLFSTQFSLKAKNVKINNFHLFKIFSLIALIAFLLQLYVVAAWGREIIGGPYGSRMFVSVLPHLGLGIAYLVEKFKNQSKFYIISFLAFLLFFANNLLQTIVMLVRF